MERQIEDYSFEEIKVGFLEGNKQVLIAFIHYTDKIANLVVRKHRGNIVDAYEVRQEICKDFFLRCLKNQDHKSIENIRAYLNRAINNKAIDILYRKTKPSESLEVNEWKLYQEMSLKLDTDYYRKVIDDVLLKINKDCRFILKSIILEGWRHEDIGTRLGTTPDAARKRFERCKKSFVDLIFTNPEYSDLIEQDFVQRFLKAK